MKRSAWRLILLGLVCVAQLAVPAVMLARHEGTLARGAAYRFECAPVDPVDFFRGRYVALNFDAAAVEIPADFEFERGDKLFVRVAEGDDGFARLHEPSRTRPREGVYLPVRIVGWPGHRPVTVRLPFDRYYMEEGLAPEAEQAYRDAVGRDDVEAWVAVRILDGRAVIEELYIDGLPVREYLAEVARP